MVERILRRFLKIPAPDVCPYPFSWSFTPISYFSKGILQIKIQISALKVGRLSGGPDHVSALKSREFPLVADGPQGLKHRERLNPLAGGGHVARNVSALSGTKSGPGVVVNRERFIAKGRVEA